MRRRRLFQAVCGLALAASLSAKAEFSGIALDGNRLLFSVESSIPTMPAFRALFETDLGRARPEDKPKLLTCFPEQMERLHDGSFIEISSRYGTALYSVNDKKLDWVTTVSEIPTSYKRLTYIEESPDGDYYCYVDESGHESKLCLVNARTGDQIVLNDKSEAPRGLNFDSIRVKWSPDGAFLLYEKDGSVYFTNPQDAFKRINVPESYRAIGEGTIESTEWTLNRGIIYIRGDTVYRIEQNELYTRGLFAPFVGTGKILGRLSAPFNPAQDKLWVNSDGTSIAITIRDTTAAVYTQDILSEEREAPLIVKSIFPLNSFSNSAYRFEFFWDSRNPVLWVDTIDPSSSEKKSIVYRSGGVRTSGAGISTTDMGVIFEAASSITPSPSPDRKRIAYTDNGSLCIYDTDERKTIFTDTKDAVVSVLWDGNTVLYAGGTQTIRKINLETGEDDVILLSQAFSPSWAGGRITCMNQDGTVAYVFDEDTNTWTPIPTAGAEHTPSASNANYRVFLSTCPNKNFTNAIYVRSLAGNGKTYGLYDEPERKESASRKRVALVFDAMEGCEGTAKILYTLKEYGLKCTFFLNGDFIRRYPEQVRQIAASGNECASMFFTSADLTENSYVISNDFIERGLARCEDEFYGTTGAELLPMWHAPHYKANSAIKKAGSLSGYTYIDAFGGDNDTVTFEDSGLPYLSAQQLVNLYTRNLKDGAVLSVSVGRPYGTRGDWLYEKLDLLISNILDAGYDIVCASAL